MDEELLPRGQQYVDPPEYQTPYPSKSTKKPKTCRQRFSRWLKNNWVQFLIVAGSISISSYTTYQVNATRLDDLQLRVNIISASASQAEAQLARTTQDLQQFNATITRHNLQAVFALWPWRQPRGNSVITMTPWNPATELPPPPT